jgi:hypothetical protein
MFIDVMIQKIFMLATILGGEAASYTGGIFYGCANSVF